MGSIRMPVQENGGKRNYWRVSAHGSSGAALRAARGAARVFCAFLAFGCSAAGGGAGSSVSRFFGTSVFTETFEFEGCIGG